MSDWEKEGKNILWKREIQGEKLSVQKAGEGEIHGEKVYQKQGRDPVISDYISEVK